MLFYREALELDKAESQRRIADVNAGMAGGDHAKERMKALGRAK